MQLWPCGASGRCVALQGTNLTPIRHAGTFAPTPTEELPDQDTSLNPVTSADEAP